MEKQPMKCLFRDDPATKEGKYLVKRRDGTVVERSQFVLGGRDPHAAVALRAYADSAAEAGHDANWVESIRRLADDFDAYREQHGEGDPHMGKHRPDDPATIAEMCLGHGG